MKRLCALWRWVRARDQRLIALCYAVFFAGSVLWALFGFAEDACRRAGGSVQQAELAGEAELRFGLTDLVREDGLYVSTSVDPRIELPLDAVSADGASAYVRRVTLYAEFLNMEPGELTLFYKPRPSMEEYDAIYRVWARQEAPGVYTFTLPMGKVYGLRLDPGIYTDLRFRLERVALNEPRPFGEWFLPTRPWLLAMAAVPLLAASVLKYLCCVWDAAQAKRRKKQA